jgi:protein-S-isoprenylcysteine O-methyltransferase Ste14
MNHTTGAERRHQWVFSHRRALVMVAAIVAGLGMAFEDSSWAVGWSHWLWVQISAVAMILYGESYRMWATWHIGGRKNQTVVTTGPYAWSRNPLYVGSLFCVLGISILAASAVALVVGVSALAWIYGATVRHEEAYLLRTLGDEYREYMARVPRFFPSRGMNAATRIAQFKANGEGAASPIEPSDSPATEHRPPARMLWREAYTGLGFVLAGAAAVGIQHGVAWLKANGHLPVLLAIGKW